MRIKLSRESFINFVLVCVLFEGTIKTLFLHVFSAIGFNRTTELFGFLFNLIVVIGFIIFLSSSSRKKISLSLFLFISLMIIYYIYGNNQYPSIFINSFDSFRFLIIFPIVAIMYSNLVKYDNLMYQIIVFSRVLSWINFLEIVLLIIKSGNNSESHSMTIGYNMALCAVFLFYAILKYHYWYDKVIFSALLFLVVFYGNRGALLVVCLAVFIMYYHEKKNKIFENRRTFILFFTCVLMVLILIYTRSIWLQGLNSVANSLGLTSRNLNKILEGNISDDNGRNVYHLYIISCFKDMPIWGYGLLSDRYFLSNSYVHSLYLEFICDFGYYIGGFLLVHILVSLVRTLKNAIEKRPLVLLLSIYTITQLTFSSSFTLSLQFYILLGVIFASFKSQNY